MTHAELTIGDKTIKLPVVEGTEGEIAVDISKLRSETGVITLDNGYVNTGSCESKITYIDGEKGILRHRGYSIESICEQANFLEVAFLVIYGELPTQEQYDEFVAKIKANMTIHEDMAALLKTLPHNAHPMSMFGCAVNSLSAFYPENLDPLCEETREKAIIHLLAKIPTIAAWNHRIATGQPVVYPQERFSYLENLLYMMFKPVTSDYEVDRDVLQALELLLMLHADHEQNCSTATVRVIGSSQANLFSSVAGGVCALWGPLHGGANQKVIEMLRLIQQDGGDIQKYLELAKDKSSNFRLMGFGHRVYKNFDPRARIIKKQCDVVLNKLGVKNPLLKIAKSLEEAALADPYFVERKLYPNVDFYSGIIYEAIGIPVEMFTVMFAMGRAPGWIAQYKEMIENPKTRIGRPRQVYQGEPEREFQSLVTKH